MIAPLHLFPTIGWFQHCLEADTILFDGYENWVKQTRRNRYEIVGPNGLQALSIPTVKLSRKRFIDVEISYTEDWVNSHLRSIKTAYNRSPFFEYYLDDFEALLHKRTKYLFELNWTAIQWCFSKLGLEKTLTTTTAYSEQLVDEHLYLLKSPIAYYQVFQEKNGFLENTSILDLLFNAGPEAQSILLHKPPLS